MATKKKHRTQESWPGFDEGLDAVPSGDYVTPGGGRYERTTPPTLTGAAAARAKRLLGVCELEGGCQKVAGHDGPCTRRNPHEQYYGDEEAPEDTEHMRRLKAISDAVMARKNPREELIAHWKGPSRTWAKVYYAEAERGTGVPYRVTYDNGDGAQYEGFSDKKSAMRFAKSVLRTPGGFIN